MTVTSITSRPAFNRIAKDHASKGIPSIVRYYHEYTTPGSKDFWTLEFDELSKDPKFKNVHFLDVDGDLVKDHLSEMTLLNFPAFVLYTNDRTEALRVLEDPFELRGGKDYEEGLEKLLPC